MLGLQLLVTPPGATRARIFDLQDFSKTLQDVREQLAISEDDKEIRATLGAEVLFDLGKYDLRPAPTATLDQLATLLTSYPGLPILIEGHTDNVGRPDPNQVLSEHRADALKTWLVSRGGVPGQAGRSAKTRGPKVSALPVRVRQPSRRPGGSRRACPGARPILARPSTPENFRAACGRGDNDGVAERRLRRWGVGGRRDEAREIGGCTDR